MPGSSVSAPAPGDWDYRGVAPIPFATFQDELLALYAPPHRARNTWRKMRQVLGIVAGLDARTTADLTPMLVTRLIEGRPAGESSQTTHTLLAYIRAACSYAKAQGYIRTSPFEWRKKWVRLGRPGGKRHHTLAEIDRVLSLLASEVAALDGWPRWRARRLLAMTATFAYTGLRRDEGLKLRIGDIDLDGRMIHLVERGDRRLKTEASAVPVPIPAALAPILVDWLAHRMDADGDQTPPDCYYLFPGVTRKGPWTGGPNGHKAIDRLKAAGERAGVQGLTFLSFRHSFATHAESWGLSPAMIQRVLRHTSLSTQGHYRHADLDNMRSAVDGIGFGPPAPDAAPDAKGGAPDAS